MSREGLRLAFNATTTTTTTATTATTATKMTEHPDLTQNIKNQKLAEPQVTRPPLPVYESKHMIRMREALRRGNEISDDEL